LPDIKSQWLRTGADSCAFADFKSKGQNGEERMIGSLMMCVGVVILLVGMLAGIDMGIRQDFVLAPAHAHLNLVGGVLLFLFGLYYRVIPSAGALSFVIAPIIGSLIVIAAIALFMVIVFRTSRT
jgi:hypothetical protein